MARFLRLFAVLVVLAFGGYALWRGGRDLPVLPVEDPPFWLWLGAALGLYLLSQLLAARAWGGTLAIFSVHLPRGWAETQLLVSQIGKYVPGNLAHLLGRFALARADGVPGPLAAVAMVTEITLVLGAAGVLMIMFLLFNPDLKRLMPETGLSSSMSSIGLFLLLGAGVAAGIWLLLRQIRRQAPQAVLVPGAAVLPLALHGINFLLLGLSLAFVVYAISPGNDAAFLSIPVFILAWTLGFLMPGSPGGMGTREGLIVLGLGLALGDGNALTTALLHRAVSICGDLMTFAVSYRFRAALIFLRSSGRR